MSSSLFLRIVFALTVLAFAVRALFIFMFPVEIPLEDDPGWYWDAARNFACCGIFDQSPLVPFARPPGFPLLLSAGHWVFGESVRSLQLLVALVSSLGTMLAALIGRQVWPDRPRLAAAVAGLYAVDPAEAWWPRTLLSEPVVITIVLAFVWATIRARGIRGSATAGFLCAVMTLFRVDLIALVALFPLSQLIAASSPRRSIRIVAVNTVVCVATCGLFLAPWSLYATERLGKPILVSQLPWPDGYDRWLSTLDLSSRAWQQATFSFWKGRLSPDWVDEVEELSPAARDEARSLLQQVEGAPERARGVYERFEDLAWRRIKAAPWRVFVLLPLKRSVHLWSHFEQATGPGKRGLFGNLSTGVVVFSLWKLPYVSLMLCGFLGAFFFVARVGTVLSSIAAAVLLRTYSLLFAGALAGKSGLEVRYLGPVHLLAIIVALEVIRRLIAVRGWWSTQTPTD